MELRAVGYEHPDSVRLIAEVQQEYVRRYGGPDKTPTDPAEFEPPRGLFLVGYLDGRPVACGGWRAQDGMPLLLDGDAEIKRMYVTPALRGRGLSRVLLAELERTAAAAGRLRMVLETGPAQPEAIALYSGTGYAAIRKFGAYRNEEGSICCGKPLLVSPPVAGRPLHEIVEAGWATALEPVADRIAAMGDFLRAELAAGRRYLPAGEHVLRAFTQPLDEVRVLIVGQDPYPTPGHPVGLSFSVAPEVRPLPRSLVNIYTEYTADLGHPLPSTGDLSPWCERGVMLLNRVLTVQPGVSASHRGKGWEEVTDQAIRALVARGTPLVAILWGRDARTLKPALAPYPCVESAHPSPMSAQYGFFGSRPFSKVNDLLVAQGADPVDWKLP